MARSPQSTNNPESPRPYGSSAIISIVVVGVVMAILVIGSLFILNGLDSDDGDDGGSGVIPSPSSSSELVTVEPSATPIRDAQSTSPSATATSVSATATEEPVSEPTSTEIAPTESSPEPTATSEPLPEPSNTPVPEPTATELPLEGEFGFLPPAQLPSGGVSTTLTLEYQLGMSLEALPTSGTVYRIAWPVYTLEDVEFARDRLGLQANVVEEGVGVFRVDSARGTLYVSPTEIDFRAAGFSEGSGLPDDATAIAAAREWVDLSGFISGQMDAGEVIGRDEELERVIVKFRPVAPQPNLAPNPAATVTLGPGATVLEVHIAWPADLESSDYGYSDALDVWQEILNGRGFLEADISSVFATGQLTGVATMTDYSTAYTLAGSAAGSQYLVPVITFQGTARIDQTGDEIPVFVSIPVVYFEEGTAG